MSILNISSQQITEKIGKRICVLRKQKKISREELACRIGVCPQQIYKYEIGQNRITADRLIIVALALNLKINDFFPPSDIEEKSDNSGDSKMLSNIYKLKKLSGEKLMDKLMELLVE